MNSKTTNDRLENIRFITIPENRKIGKTELKSNIPLPVQFEKGQKPEDLDLASIAAGLIKVCAHDAGNAHFEYYREILLEMQPDTVKELNLAAIAKSKKKEFDFAEELMLAVNHISRLPESYVNLAVLYAQMTVDFHKKGNDALADMYDDRILDILKECSEKHPDYAPAYSEISAYHMRHGDVETARDFLEKFVSLTKDAKAKESAKKTLDGLNKMISSKDRILYAYDKMMMGCSDEAVETINGYLASNKPCWEAFFIRGWAKRALDDFDGAQKDLLESLKIDGQNAEVYNELSICARESGNIELAKSYLQIASDLDDESVVYLTNLAFLHLADSEFSEAREMIEKARALDAQDPQLLSIIKDYEEKTGDRLSDVIREEIYGDEDFEELHRKEHEEHTHHEEI
ncbi:MAG: hypothetical protein MJ052_03155 [Sphaerochaetaceae bacterium]|nr:hypothetical protein [Sphaerochaetaceae bacterium]